jgi:hypothetical protein
VKDRNAGKCVCVKERKKNARLAASKSTGNYVEIVRKNTEERGGILQQLGTLGGLIYRARHFRDSSREQ